MDPAARVRARPDRLWAVLVIACIALIAFLDRAPERVSQAHASPVEAADLKGSGDRAPRLVNGPPPVAPAKYLAINPTIVCRARIGMDGKVADAKPYQS